MLAVGIGKHAGASSIHNQGFEKMGHVVPLAARFIAGRVNIVMGIAVIQIVQQFNLTTIDVCVKINQSSSLQ